MSEQIAISSAIGRIARRPGVYAPRTESYITRVASCGSLLVQKDRILASLICIVAFCGQCRQAHAERTSGPYVLKVIHPFAISAAEYREGGVRGNLVRLSPGYDDGTGQVIIPVRRYALWEDHIVGRAESGFFILNTVQARTESTVRESLKITDNEEEWRRLLQSHGVPATISLLDPDSVAGERKNRDLRPWQYDRMHGLLGLRDGDWAACIAFLGVVVSFGVGMVGRPRPCRWMLAGGIGLSSVIVGPLVIGGGGAAAGVALFIWPATCVAAMAGGSRCRRGKQRQTKATRNRA